MKAKFSLNNPKVKIFKKISYFSNSNIGRVIFTNLGLFHNFNQILFFFLLQTFSLIKILFLGMNQVYVSCNNFKDSPLFMFYVRFHLIFFFNTSLSTFLLIQNFLDFVLLMINITIFFLQIFIFFSFHPQYCFPM